jgi:prepilin-type N-terminal cleavage/methylation domain-containing protein
MKIIFLKNNIWNKKKANTGFSLLELVLAVAIFSLGSFAMATMLIDSNISTRLSTERTEALFHAKEGIEAVRSIRDNDWSDLVEGSAGLAVDPNTSLWTLSGSSDSIGDNDKYTRTVSISTDPENENLKNVSVNIAWNFTPSRIASTTLSTIFSDWIHVENTGFDFTDGLISYWSFDGDADDDFGTNDGTASGATLTTGVGGVPNTAYSFDGADDYIDVVNNVSLNPSAEISISVWINSLNISQGVQTIVCKPASSGWSNPYARYCLRVAANKIQFWTQDFFSRYFQSAITLSSNTWYHIAATYDGSTQKIYINGSLDYGASLPASGSITSSIYNLAIGSHATGASYGEIFYGSIDEVRIYNRALLPEEISALYSEYGE